MNLEKRGLVLVVFFLMLAFFSTFSQADRCLVYPEEEDLFCVDLARAEEQCRETPGCDPQQDSVSTSCPQLAECRQVTCNVDCQIHAQGICQQKGGQEVPEAEYTYWCSPGCCKIANTFCQFNLNKYQCDLKAQQLGMSSGSVIFDNPLGMNAEQCNRLYCRVEIQPASLGGFVLDTAENSLPNVRVLLGGTNLETFSSPDGVYSLTDLNPGTYLVRVQAEGYSPVSFSLSLRPGETLQQNFTLFPVGELTEISGTIYDTQQNPLLGATLAWSGPGRGQVLSDAQGRYRTSLPPGDYLFTVSKVGFQIQALSLTLGVGALAQDFVLERARLQGVKGTVYVDYDGNNLIDLGEETYGAKIYIDGTFKGYSRFPDGSFEEEIQVGEGRERHQIKATYENYESQQELEIAPGETLTQSLLLTAYIGECTEPGTEKGVEIFSAFPAPGKKELRLEWIKPCPEVIGYKVTRLREGEAEGSFELSPLVNSYLDTQVEWGKEYAYEITAFYDRARISSPTVSAPVNVGNRFCQGKYHGPESGWETFCLFSEHEARKKVWTCNDQNQLIASLDCLERGGEGEDYYCAKISAREAECKNAGPCRRGGNPLGLYYSASACYGTTNLDEGGAVNYCYYDYSPTIVDQCRSCTEIESCFEYQSRDACLIDNCLDGQCQWINATANAEPMIDYGALNLPVSVTPETGHGYCVEKGHSADDRCSLCGPEASLFENYYCTAEVCRGLGRCFSQENLAYCRACGEGPSRQTNCYTYHTDLECVNQQGIEKSPSGEITLSEDRCGWGRCLWMGEADSYSQGSCVKDGNADGNDDCASFPAAGERAACQLDHSPPRTKIVPGGVKVISQASPTLTFQGDDVYHNFNNQRSKMGRLGFCLTSASPSAPSFCRAEDFVEEPYPGKLTTEQLNVNLLEHLSKEVNGETYRLKFYSQDKYLNREDLQEAFVFIDNVPPKFEINEDIDTVGDRTKLTVYLQGHEEPMSCLFNLKPVLPRGEEQVQAVAREEREKKVVFESLPGIRYDLNVSCEDNQGNRYSEEKSYTFDLEQDIDLVNPEPYGIVSAREISFQVRTTVGATCGLYLTAGNEKVADFVTDDLGKEHRTPPVGGLVEKEYAAEYKVVCQELLEEESHEDYFHFTVDFTPPSVQIILREGTREERPREYGWEEFFVNSVLVDFECAADGFACDKVFYCLGEGCELTASSHYQEYSASRELTNSTKICYYARDTAGNPVYQPMCGSLVIDGYGLTLERPLQHYYQGEQWGVSNSPVFIWQFYTRVPTQECRFDFLSGFSYETVAGFKVLSPNSQGRYVLENFPASTGLSPYPEAGGVKTVYVKCKNGEGEIGPEEKMNLEFDPSAPTIKEAYAEPNPLLEGNKVDLVVNTDDKTLCKYSDAGQTDYGSMSYAFPGAEADLPRASAATKRLLVENHRVPFNVNTFLGLVKEFSLNTVCKNGGGDHSGLKTINFTVDYTRLGGLAFLWPNGDYLSVRNVTLQAETTKNALCEIKKENSYLPMEGAGGKAHTYLLSGLIEGDYRYPLRCRMGDHLVENQFTFAIDLTMPVISQVEDGNYSCGSAAIPVMVYTNEDNLSAYYYELYELGETSSNLSSAASRRNVSGPRGELVLNGSVEARLPIEIPTASLNESHRYQARIKARDAAGNWGNFKESDGVIIVPRNDSVCEADKAAPVINFVINESSCTFRGIEMFCEDASLCRQFRYGQSASPAQCSADKNYNGQKILFPETAWLCYQVEDALGNNASGQRRVVLEDEDGDSIINRCDLCPETEAGGIVDEKGCASDEVPEEERHLDTDGDGLPDHWEKLYSHCGLSYSSLDTDGDSLRDGDEDYDDDSFSNSEEFRAGTDPCSALDKPKERKAGAPSPLLSPPEKANWLAWIFLVLGLLLVGGGATYLVYYYYYSPRGRTALFPGVRLGKEIKPSVKAGEEPPFGRWWPLKKFRREKEKERERKRVFGAFGPEVKEIPFLGRVLRQKAPPSLPQLQTLAEKYAEHKEAIKPGLRKEEENIFARLEKLAQSSKKGKAEVSQKKVEDIFAQLKAASQKRKKGS